MGGKGVSGLVSSTAVRPPSFQVGMLGVEQPVGEARAQFVLNQIAESIRVEKAGRTTGLEGVRASACQGAQGMKPICKPSPM